MHYVYRHGIYIELTLGVISLVLLIASYTRAAIFFIVLALVISALIRHKADRRAINEKKDHDSSTQQLTTLEEQVKTLQNDNNILKDDFSIFQNETNPRLEGLRSDVDAIYQGFKSLELSLATSEEISQNIQQIFSLLEDQNQEVQLLQTKDDNLKELSEQLHDLFSTITNGAITPIQNSQENYDCFIRALENCEQRLIIVCPWIRQEVLDYNNPEESKTIRNLIINNLKNKREIYFGWGHWKDTYSKDKRSYLTKKDEGISRKAFFKAVKSNPDKSFMYTGFKWLESLEKNYPSQFQLKFLGTHEKYVICDQKTAMIGSHNFMTSAPKKTDWELGIEITDKLIISALANRFMTQRNLENPVQ